MLDWLFYWTGAVIWTLIALAISVIIVLTVLVVLSLFLGVLRAKHYQNRQVRWWIAACETWPDNLEKEIRNESTCFTELMPWSAVWPVFKSRVMAYANGYIRFVERPSSTFTDDIGTYEVPMFWPDPVKRIDAKETY